MLLATWTRSSEEFCWFVLRHCKQPGALGVSAGQSVPLGAQEALRDGEERPTVSKARMSEGKEKLSGVTMIQIMYGEACHHAVVVTLEGAYADRAS